MLTRTWFILCLIVMLTVASKVAHAQWQQTANSPKGSGVTALAVRESNGYLFATTGSFNWPSADTGGVHRSTDAGNTWTRVFPAYIARTIAIKDDSILFASVWPDPSQTERLYFSTDNGTTWNLTLDGGAANNIFAIAFRPDNPMHVYLGTRYGTVRNLSGGTTGSWTVVGNLPLGSWVTDMAIAKTFFGVTSIFAAVLHPSNPNLNGVYQSTDGGTSYLRRSTTNDTVTSMIIVPDTTFGPAGFSVTEGEAIYYGTKNGKIYKGMIFNAIVHFLLMYTLPGNPEATAFAASTELQQAFIFMGFLLNFTGGGGCAYTPDRGQTWLFYDDNLPDRRPLGALIYDPPSDEESGESGTLYAGMFLNENDGAHIYKRNVVTGVETPSPELPDAFELNQNYPNPFNPSTHIEYSVPHTSHVKLTVQNLLGQLVATLVEEEHSAGRFTTEWNGMGSNGMIAGSGVYFYTLKVLGGGNASDYAQTRKMVLIR